jgi:hypothetical protein
MLSCMPSMREAERLSGMTIWAMESTAIRSSGVHRLSTMEACISVCLLSAIAV